MSQQPLSRSGLDRLHRAMSGFVERGDVPGLVALLSRDDAVHVETIGSLGFDDPTPMRRDTIFRIASITKLITAVAAMILVEEARMRLDDPIDPWLPELANRRVLTRLASEISDTVLASRAITVRDVLTYCMGFGSVMALPGTYPVQQLIREYRIGGDGPMLPTDYPPTDEWLRRLGSLPLLAQPGKRWMYQVSGDVLGALVARVSGQTLGRFMHERLFEPLGMRDTGFFVPPGQLERLAVFYKRNPQTDALEVFDEQERTAWRTQPAFESGGGGLVSTLDDYFTFSRMMLNKGGLGGTRILSRAAVELMTSDQLTPEQRAGSDIFFGRHSSWGLGIAVDIARREIYHRPGRFGWTGGFGTIAYIDPTEQLIGMLFTQRMMDSPEPPRVFTDFWTLAYAALE